MTKKSKKKTVTNKTSKRKKQAAKFCPECENKFVKVIEPFESTKLDADTGKKIIIKDAFYFKCSNKNCGHTWVPSEEISRIENIIFNKSWRKLNVEQITQIRESFGFATKSRASRFLGLNEKAFVKIEKGSYSELNLSTDLLLRLAAFSKQNFNFIKSLHDEGFAFNKFDYEMLCDSERQWNYRHISTKENVKGFYKINIDLHSGLEIKPGSDARTTSILIKQDSSDWYKTDLNKDAYASPPKL